MLLDYAIKQVGKTKIKKKHNVEACNTHKVVKIE